MFLALGQDVAAQSGQGDSSAASAASSSSSAAVSSRPSAWAWSGILLSIGAVLDPGPLEQVGRVGSDYELCVECQPSRHRAARRVLARSAHERQTEASVWPQGTRTCSTWTVCRSVRRRWAGRMQPLCSAARLRDDIAG